MAREIINTHDQLRAAGGGVAIVPASLPGRSPYQYGWAVYRVNAEGKGLVTDKDAAWYEYGKKVFSDLRSEGGRMGALAAAKAWVAEQGWYDGPWTRNRMRDYVPTEMNKQFPLRRDQ